MNPSFAHSSREKIRLFFWMDESEYDSLNKDSIIYPSSDKKHDVDKYILNKYNDRFNTNYDKLVYTIGLLNHHKLFSYEEYLSLLYTYSATHHYNKYFKLDGKKILIELYVPLKELKFMMIELLFYNRVKTDLKESDLSILDNVEKQMGEILGENYPLYTFNALGYVLLPYIKYDWVCTTRTIPEIMSDVYHYEQYTQDCKAYLIRKCHEALGDKAKYYDIYHMTIDGYNGRGTTVYHETVYRPIDAKVSAKRIL